jgi:hypothetical protein
MKASRTWHGDWETRLLDRLRDLGYTNTLEFLQAFPGHSYKQLVDTIGDCAVVQLEFLQFKEAEAADRLREAAMDCLTRNLRSYLPRGWGRSDFDSTLPASVVDWLKDDEVTNRSRFLIASAICHSSASLVRFGAEKPKKMVLVGKALQELNPPLGWQPAGPDDPLIVAAFAVAWPEDR